MLFDRISLVEAYDALRVAEANEGIISQILFNKTAYYGTKTVVRFDSVRQLRQHIEQHFAYQQFDPNCECATCNDSIWQLLSFTVQLPDMRYVSFVNNLRGQFESAEGALLNKTTKDRLALVFKKNARLAVVKNNATCFGYIENQGKYVSPCDYITVIKNAYHDELIALYLKTKGIYGLARTEIYVDKCRDVSREKPAVWDTTTVDPCLDLAATHEIVDAQSIWEATTTLATTTEATTTLATTEATTTLATTLATTTEATTTEATTTEATTTEATTTVQQMGPALILHSTQNYDSPSSFWDYNAIDSNGNYVHDDCAVVSSYENPSLGNMTGGVDTYIKSQQNGLNFQIGDTMEWWNPINNTWGLISEWGMGPDRRGVYEDTTGILSGANENWIIVIENGILVQLTPFSTACITTTEATTTEATTTEDPWANYFTWYITEPVPRTTNDSWQQMCSLPISKELMIEGAGNPLDSGLSNISNKVFRNPDGTLYQLPGGNNVAPNGYWVVAIRGDLYPQYIGAIAGEVDFTNPSNPYNGQMRLWTGNDTSGNVGAQQISGSAGAWDGVEHCPEPTTTEATTTEATTTDPLEGYYTYYMTTPIEKLPYPNNQSAQDLYCAPGETITTVVKHISSNVLNMGNAAFFNTDGTPYTLLNTNPGIQYHVLIFRADKFADRNYDIGSNTTELDLRRSGGQYGGHLMLHTDNVPGPGGYLGNVTGAVPLAAAQGWWNEDCPEPTTTNTPPTS